MRKTAPKSPSRPNRRTMWPRAPEPPPRERPLRRYRCLPGTSRCRRRRRARESPSGRPTLRERRPGLREALGRHPGTRPLSIETPGRLRDGGERHLPHRFASLPPSRRRPGPGRSTRSSSRGRNRARSARPRPTRLTPNSSPSSRGRKGTSAIRPPSTTTPPVFGSTAGSASAS